MTWGHAFRCGSLLGRAQVESLFIHLSLQLDPAIDQHVSSRKALRGLKVLPKLLWRATSLVPELLESIAIGINGTSGLLCAAPFWKTVGRDKFAHSWLPNLELPGYPRNRSSFLMQCHNLVIKGEAALS